MDSRSWNESYRGPRPDSARLKHANLKYYLKLVAALLHDHSPGAGGHCGIPAAFCVGMRFAKTKINGRRRTEQGILNVGYAATIDCAVLIAAQELGLFRKQGLEVRLSREVGWTTIREKLLHEELDAAATHASMLFSIYCGIGVVRRPCLSGLLLGRNGSAITLAKAFWDEGVRDAATLGQLIQAQRGRRISPSAWCRSCPRKI